MKTNTLFVTNPENETCPETQPKPPRLISLAEVRDAVRQVNQDQSTWRSGPAALEKLLKILSALAALALLVLPAAAQSTTPGLTATDYQMKLANLERQVQTLTAENAALKKAIAALTAPGTAVVAAAPPAAPVAAAVPNQEPRTKNQEPAGNQEPAKASLQAEIEKEKALQASIEQKMAAQEKEWNKPPDPFTGKKPIGTAAADKVKLRDQVARAIAESKARQAAHEAALRAL